MTNNKSPSSRDLRQQEAIEKWINIRCKGTFQFCTGFGI